MNSKESKIVLIGIMGNGKSSVANIFAGKEVFKVSNMPEFLHSKNGIIYKW